MSLTDAQLALRKTTLGASEVAAACGLSPYRRPIEVWARKVGLAPPENAATLRRFRLGHAMEEAVAGEYAELCGMNGASLDHIAVSDDVWPNGTDGTVLHPDHPWCSATPDRVVRHRLLNDDGSPRFVWETVRLVELKTATGFSADGWEGYEGADGFYVGAVPVDYEAQAIWQMLVTGVHACDLAVLINGSDFRAYHIPWDADLAAALFARASRFWTEYVQTGIAPPRDGSDAWASVYADLHRKPFTRPSLLDASEEYVALARRYVELTAMEKAADAEKTAIKQQFMEIIAGDLGMENRAEGVKVSWRFDEKGRTAWAEVAKALNPPEELIAKHTTPPGRTFTVSAKTRRGG